MKPIIFSTPMVQAILDGRKSMTRRVVKLPQWVWVHDESLDQFGFQTGNGYGDGGIIGPNDLVGLISHYQPGDILWVRETWAKISDWSDVCPETGMFDGYIYKADWPSSGEHPKWRPSIFMPREAARIFLRVTNVRAERVQDITEDDAIAEGVGDLFFEEIGYSNNPKYDLLMEWKTLEREQFELLWNSINAKRGFGWDSNPWVWVIEFERCEKPEAADA